jgi:UDP-N-acetylmuramoyl-tripeptide--D-alanyl-D-alanine ligase
MKTLLDILLFAAMVFAMVIPVKHTLFIFQQNRYEIGRMNAWLKENIWLNAAKSMIPLFLAAAGIILGVIPAICEHAAIIVCILLGLYGFKDEKTKTYIKPLVYTGRVKRQIAVMAVLAALWNLALILSDFYFAAPLSAYLMSWVLLYPMAGITAPVEAAVKESYLNDAKRILKQRPDLIRIGITGSFGKTTTKNIVQSVLSERYNSLMTPASYNTPMGITRTIRELLKPIHQVFVCEMGADHVGEISYLMDFVHPSIGIVTSIGPQHLNTFGSQENIIHEKMMEVEMLPENGYAILNYDNEFIREYQIRSHVKRTTYGIQNQDADYRAVNIVYSQTGSHFTVVHEDEEIEIETRLLGELNVLNILAAVAAARYLKVDWHTIQRACRQMKQVEHRLELKKINGYRFIDDAFNSNPTGSAMALNVLAMMPNHRYLVTPGMIDLGERQNELNKHFGTLMKNRADTVILVGEIQTKPIYEGLQESGFDMNNVIVMSKERDALTYIYQNASVQDTILLENDLPDAFNH